MKTWAAIGVVASVFFTAGYFSATVQKDFSKKERLQSISTYREKQISSGARQKAELLSLKEQLLAYRQFTLPLNNPDVVPVTQAQHMSDDDLVTGVLAGGMARAYPWWILANYHVVNDVLGGIPILVTLCEACGASAAFRANIPDRMSALDFFSGETGVRFGTFKISDTATNSVWHPFLGLAFQGELKGQKLERLPAQLFKWGQWRTDHPDSDVVFASTEMRLREHGMLGATEIGEPGMSARLASVSNLNDKRLPRHSIVFGMVREVNPATIGTQKARGLAYPLEKIEAQGGLVYDSLEGEEIVILKTARFALKGFSRLLDGKLLDLKIVSQQPVLLKDQDGHMFDEWGREVDANGRKGSKQLKAINGYVTEWYEWASAFPGSEIFGSKQ